LELKSNGRAQVFAPVVTALAPAGLLAMAAPAAFGGSALDPAVSLLTVEPRPGGAFVRLARPD
jgi:hypothetical protein